MSRPSGCGSAGESRLMRHVRAWHKKNTVCVQFFSTCAAAGQAAVLGPPAGRGF